ncbi:multidrug transporter AcrB [Thalassotalea insulae]|uniref:Multidrug transporter AcrB n=1 Tax=Thalassotalea insulae TaxID=2056778 RepID=A0ABQ6GVK8_9GAMM|nr:efflux RND transporter permease subunit [Thalassotalea insulae]GLX78216.1 multidrug transporter AcrB [Thalassotalea insulae]
MKLPRIAINNAQFTLTIVILLVLVGIVSYFNMPRSEDPQFDIPITLIEVIYPGVSPNDIETLAVNPLEQEFADIEGIKQIETQIKNDGARIEIKFIYGSDPQIAFDEVKQAVATVKPKLPSDVQDVLVLKATPTSVAVAQLALWSEPINYKEMEFYAKKLEKRLETIASVKKADIWGYPQQVVSIDLNLDLLQHYGLSVNHINQVLQGRALNITPGFLDASSRRFNVKASGNYQQVSQLAETVIYSNAELVVKLEDVATIEFGHAKPSYLAYFNENPVIFITLEQRKNTNIFDLTKQLTAEVDDFRQQLPSNVKVTTIFEQADSVETRVNGFFDNLWQGLALVGVMSLLFLGVREALVVIAVIPLSFLIAIGWLDFAGFGLQQMSIVGLIIALGLLVDNAIVVTESIHREKKLRLNLKEAAASGTSRVGWAITSGTVTTMFAFLPMLMIASDTGDFIRSMPVTVVLVLLASLLLALTFTPLLSSKLFQSKSSKFKMLQHYVNAFALNHYKSLLSTLMKRKLLVVVVFIIALAGMFSLFSKVGLSLFPKAEKPMMLIEVEAPRNSSLAYTNDVVHQVAEKLKGYQLVDELALNVGNSNPRIYYNEVPKRGVANYGQILVVLSMFDEHQISQLVAQLRSEFSSWHQAKITVKEFTQGPVTDQPITVRLMSESLTELEVVAKDLGQFMANLDGVINIENPIGLANTELVMDIDYEKAGMSGIDINQLDLTLKTIISGNYVGQFSDSNGESYPILVHHKNADLTVLDKVYIANKLGQLVPLSQVVSVELAKGHSEFFHYQKQRMAKVSADADHGYSVTALTQQVVSYLDNYPFPVGMYYTLGGEEESRQESFAGLTQIMIITAIGIFSVLVLQFKSFMQPLVIFTSIPFAIAGSVIGLYLFELSFSMMAFIGLISLFGIVVNNAIILIDTANYNFSQSGDMRLAILDASATRFTPILLTTLTTIGGLLPLTLFGGSLWQPLGVVIISGLCVSAIASFMLVPILTQLFTRTNS